MLFLCGKGCRVDDLVNKVDGLCVGGCSGGIGGDVVVVRYLCFGTSLDACNERSWRSKIGVEERDRDFGRDLSWLVIN